MTTEQYMRMANLALYFGAEGLADYFMKRAAGKR